MRPPLHCCRAVSDMSRVVKIPVLAALVLVFTACVTVPTELGRLPERSRAWDPRGQLATLERLPAMERAALCAERVYVPVPFSERVDVDGAVTYLIEPNSRSFQVALLRNLDLFLATQDPAVRARIGMDLEAAARANAWTSFSSWRGKANEPVHFLRMAILAAAIAAQVVFDDPEASATRKGSIRAWIDRMVTVADGAADDLANGPDREAGRAAAYMTWGAVGGNDRVFRLGLESFVGVSAMMRSDGSYAAFVGGPFTRYIRPDYQLRYNNMMVGWMVVAAEAAAANGLDLYGHKFRNGSLHDAVHWHVMATFNPDSQRLTGHPQATPYVKTWSPAAENMAWAATYVARFRDRPASGEIMRRGVLPAFGGDYGGRTTCLYWKTSQGG